LKKANIAIIGGTGIEAISSDIGEPMRIGTPYGLATRIFLGEVGERTVAFLPRHGINHNLPPHRVNYRANVYALHSIGATRIIATNAVGAINPEFKPGDIVVPHDVVDFTRMRHGTFYENAPVTHVDMCEPYCPEIRFTLIKAAQRKGLKAFEKAVFACSEGPRFETPAEIEVYRRLGCDVAGMSTMPEAALARELEICYATACFITNMAAGLDQHLTITEQSEIAKKTAPLLEQLLKDSVIHLPEKRQCHCGQALRYARFKG